MSAPMIASLPRDLDLDNGYTVRVTALSPTTGAVVAGVVISAAVMMAGNVLGGEPADLQSGPWVLVPGPE